MMILPPTKYARVEKYGVKLTSNLRRSADRAIRSRIDVSGVRPHRPRPDNEVMFAWVARCTRRAGAVPVDAPTWRYEPGFIGPLATQTATVRCLIPKTEAERHLFEGLVVSPDTTTLNYFDPDYEWRPAEVMRGY